MKTDSEVRAQTKGAFPVLRNFAIHLAKPFSASVVRQSPEGPLHNSFELFKSSTCHQLKELGDIDFLIEVLSSNSIRRYFERKDYAKSLYLLGMLDYISRVNQIPLCADYDDLRQCKFANPIYPNGILCLCFAFKSDEPKKQALQEAIPEFLRFNIIESDVRNVV